ncbi:class IV adenylate cyclase [Stetteria hydrogenophila]
MGHLEKEVKYRVDCGLLDALLERLRSLGARLSGPVREEDLYYNHPCRDFASTDEALRVRASRGVRVLTYKGPRLGSGSVKSRLEVEARVEGPVEEILERLGFRPVARVVKERVYAEYGGHVVTLDRVEGLGCYVEVEGPDPEGLSRELGVEGELVEETYLELLLERMGRGG